MKNILEINERISYLIDFKANKNKKKFAEMIGFAPQVISNIVSGRKSKPSFDVLNSISSSFVDINSEWLLTGKGEMLKGETPVVPATPNNGIPLLPFDAFAEVGFDVEGINFDAIKERYEVPLFDGIKVDFMLPVRGSSMYPKYSSGDVVACRMVTDRFFYQWNKVYVLDTFSQGVIMKRLKKSESPDTIVCKSDNENYDPFEVPVDDIRNIALVVGVIRLE